MDTGKFVFVCIHFLEIVNWQLTLERFIEDSTNCGNSCESMCYESTVNDHS